MLQTYQDYFKLGWNITAYYKLRQYKIMLKQIERQKFGWTKLLPTKTWSILENTFKLPKYCISSENLYIYY